MSLYLKTSKEVALDISARLKAKRLAENLTQVGLASRAGMSTPSLKRFEKTGEISFVSLLNIARVLNCLDECEHLFQSDLKPRTLFGEEEEPTTRKRGAIK